MHYRDTTMPIDPTLDAEGTLIYTIPRNGDFVGDIIVTEGPAALFVAGKELWHDDTTGPRTLHLTINMLRTPSYHPLTLHVQGDSALRSPLRVTFRCFEDISYRQALTEGSTWMSDDPSWFKAPWW
jgi:hypothetical protein